MSTTPTDDWTEPLFHLCSTQLAPGSIIEPGNWGRMIHQYGWAHAAAIRETALETYRDAKYPDLPSRFHAAFAFLTVEEAQRFRGRFGQEPATGFELHNLYRVRLHRPAAPRFVGDWRLVNPVNRVRELTRWPAIYWEGSERGLSDAIRQETEGALPHREFVTLSSLIVEQRLG